MKYLVLLGLFFSLNVGAYEIMDNEYDKCITIEGLEYRIGKLNIKVRQTSDYPLTTKWYILHSTHLLNDGEFHITGSFRSDHYMKSLDIKDITCGGR